MPICDHIQVPTKRNSVRDHANLHEQSDFLLTGNGSKTRHVIVVEGVTTISFNQGSRHELRLLFLKLQGSKYLAIFPSDLVDFATSFSVLLLQILVSPPLIFAKVGLTLEKSNDLSPFEYIETFVLQLGNKTCVYCAPDQKDQ